MKRFVCELCGSNSLRKNGNAFVCSECGVSYTLEEARSLLIDVSHSDNDTATTNDHMTQRNEGIEVGGEMPCAEPGEPGIEIAEESDVTDVVNMRISEPDSPRTPSVSEVVTHEETLEHMAGGEIGEAAQNNQQADSVPLAPLTVRFGWVGGKMLPRVFDGDEQLPYSESFIKPETESTADFCRRIAEMIENDLGRPVRYVAPEVDQQQKQKKGKKGRMGCLPIVVVIVLSSMLYQSCSGSPADSRSSWSEISRSVSSSSAKSTSTSYNRNTQKKDSSDNSKTVEQNTTSTKTTGSSNEIASYLLNRDFVTLRSTLTEVCANLKNLVATNNVSEIQRRQTQLSGAKKSFEAVEVPTACKTLYSYYIDACYYVDATFDSMKKYLNKTGNYRNELSNITKYANLANDCIENAAAEIIRLEKYTTN